MADETPKGDRIAKVLARAGVASRRDSEKLVEAGRIKVNGKRSNSTANRLSHPKSPGFGSITNPSAS